jgi:hypothetical protein
MLETCMAEINHQGELKLHHLEPLAQYTEKAGRPPPLCHHHQGACQAYAIQECQASTPQNSQAATHWPARLTRLLPHWPSRTTRFQPSGLPSCQPTRPLSRNLLSHALTASPEAYRLPSTTEGLQLHQMPAPNLPSRWRWIRLDAKGVISELLRLKFQCSWTWNTFFLFLFSSFL